MKFKVILGCIVDLRLAWDTISELLLFQKRRGMFRVMGELSWMLSLPLHSSCVANTHASMILHPYDLLQGHPHKVFR